MKEGMSENLGPRLALQGSDLERTLRFMSLLEDRPPEPAVGDVLRILGACLPSGTRKDLLGATYRQVRYVCALAGFSEGETLEFCRLVEAAGGMDSWQASYLIDVLKGSDPG